MDDRGGLQREVVTPFVVLLFRDATVCQLVLHGIPGIKNMAEFGENLKKARELKGITQQTLASKLYVTR